MSHRVLPDGSSLRTLVDGTDEWRSLAYIGDPYREVDNVTRGITLSSAAAVDSSFSKFVDSNVYHEPDDIFNGVTLGGFHETDFPPTIPSDTFFKLELTSLHVTSLMPADIWNELLTFFGEQLLSVVTKVTHSKFAIKADVIVDMMTCSVKTRIWHLGTGRFAIEFQKRSGDSICFNNTFQKAILYLSTRLNVVGTMKVPPLAHIETLPAPASCATVEADLTPLIDMMCLSGTPSLQTEAVAFLSKLAADGKSSLWSPLIFKGTGELLQTSSPDVVYPTSRLILWLSQQRGAAPLFATHGLLHKILEKVRDQDTHVEVRAQLAQALNEAAQRQSKATLSENEVAELLGSLSETLRTQDYRWGNDVISNLDMANKALGCLS
jgi:hypothetical protein